MQRNQYFKFLENKVVAAEDFGFTSSYDMTESLFPHQKTIVPWMLEGGRRACFASFGLGKTVMQLEIARHCILKTGKPFLIGLPLGVVGEFKRDNEFLNTGYDVEYIADTDAIDNYEPKIYLTNYERIRKGDIDATKFAGVSFDEASFLRSLKTETTNYILQFFKKVAYRYVFTATPAPNDFIEILNYADFLGVISRGHALTRFFQRDSTKAGKLTLYTNKKEEFWKWVSTWAVFINKPSDLGFDDSGYDLPKLKLHEVEVQNISDEPILNKSGDLVMFKDNTKSLVHTAREKSETVELRVNKAFEIINNNGDKEKFTFSNGKTVDVVIGGFYKYPDDDTIFRLKECFYSHVALENIDSGKDHFITDNVFIDLEFLYGGLNNWILWHHRESERQAIEKKCDKDIVLKSVYGSQTNKQKEDLLIDFSEGKYQILSTKPKIAGSGCNFQKHCHKAIFVGIDFKFNDFIQAVHRIHRFGQKKQVEVWVIHTQNEREVLKSLKSKWKRHIELQSEMINLVREYGLNSDKLKSDMKRQMFKNRRSATIGGATVYNDDTTLVHQEMESNSTGMILTSIPFGDHYEYSDNFNDYGHNHGNEEFFKQMDFLTPNLHRTLKPGRVAAIHVKDRIRYSHQNGTCFTTISDFSGDTVKHFEKHGFYLVGKITVTTDVVRENNQTYRLTWGEQRKDATKMGVGLPEYILLFRKAPTEKNNAYADDPVVKKIDEYLLSLWQLDAHAYWKSSGDRFLSSQELTTADMKTIYNVWKNYDPKRIYDFQEHLQVCNDLDEAGKLSKLFMTIPPVSNSDMVWTDVNRMNTLNANQVNRKKEKHICPLQLDIISRLINRFTNPGDKIDDPFGGLFSTMYESIKMGREGISAELNPEYYDDGLFYLKSIEYKLSVPTLFDTIEEFEKL